MAVREDFGWSLGSTIADRPLAPPTTVQQHPLVPPTTSQQQALAPPTTCQQQTLAPPTTVQQQALVPPTTSQQHALAPPTIVQQQALAPPTTSQQLALAPPTATCSTALPSPEDIRPFPKVGPRKVIQRRRKRTSAVLTDTPVKAEIENEKRSVDARKKIFRVTKDAPQLLKRKAPLKKKVAKKPRLEQESDEEECFCLVCIEPYTNSKSREVWLRCVHCKMWAHKDCTPGNPGAYICHNCDSCDSE